LQSFYFDIFLTHKFEVVNVIKTFFFHMVKTQVGTTVNTSNVTMQKNLF